MSELGYDSPATKQRAGQVASEVERQEQAIAELHGTIDRLTERLNMVTVMRGSDPLPGRGVEPELVRAQLAHQLGERADGIYAANSRLLELLVAIEL